MPQCAPWQSKKRVVVWGTGFVGKMVIPEVLRHPNFELVGVGVNDKDKVGRDVGDICGIGADRASPPPTTSMRSSPSAPTPWCTTGRRPARPTPTSATWAPSSGPASTCARRP